MRRIITLSFIAIATSAQYGCKYNLTEELEMERKEDTSLHDCRSCRMIELDAGANCPLDGYDCQESIPMTSHMLHAGDCGCAQLRCRDSKASLAVEGSIVGRLRCKNRKWMVGSDEATSAVCAVKKQQPNECGVGVCSVMPTVNNRFHLPLIVSPPDAQHPCAWGDCELGAIANINNENTSDDLLYLGKASFVCARDGTWTYTGPEPERDGLEGVLCVKKECYFCLEKLITITTNGAGSHEFARDTIDMEGDCAVRTLRCEGTNANIEVNSVSGIIQDGDDGRVDGVASITVTCDATGRHWVAEGMPITQLECASVPTNVPACQSCAKELITTTGQEAFTSDVVDPSGACALRTLKCEGTNAKIEINGGVSSVQDGDDGTVDDVASIQVTCDATGGKWMASGTPITQLACSSTIEPVCKVCARELITITQGTAGGKPFTTDDVNADCTERTLTCAGPNANIEVNGGEQGTFADGDDGVEDGVATFEVTCDAEAKAWTAPDFVITQLECASGAPNVPVCKSCAKELITITGQEAFASDVIDPSGACALRTLKCEGTNAKIEINGGVLSVQDGDDGTVDDVASIKVTCDATGVQWMAEGTPITQLACSTTIAPVCKICAKELITTTGGKAFASDDVDADCAVRTLTCSGPNANIEFNDGRGVIQDGDDGVADGVARIVVTCDAGEKAWKVFGVVITQLECDYGNSG